MDRPSAASREAGLQRCMSPGQEQGRHKDGEEDRDQGVLATREDALVVQGDHKERHAGHEKTGESHISNRPGLVRQVHHHVLPVLRIQPLIHHVHCIEPMEIHESNESGHIVGPKSVLHKVPVHSLDPVLVEVDAAGQEHNSCGINPVAKNGWIGRCQQVGGVVDAPSRGGIEGHSEVWCQRSDSIKPGSIDQGSSIALQVRRCLTQAEPHQLIEKENP
mmetsp:Transcript_39580/g.85510  ORF Transcript_39580/g.85510 Transcript_39580/m.85510 type:complete len:219 (+) Transcript_39580:56-712(+)